MLQTVKGLYERIFKIRPPISDLKALADFIDEQAAFVVQKGIFEYSRARAGHYSKVLFLEPDFLQKRDETGMRPQGIIDRLGLEPDHPPAERFD